jgi:hypothetical protein
MQRWLVDIYRKHRAQSPQDSEVNMLCDDTHQVKSVVLLASFAKQ